MKTHLTSDEITANAAGLELEPVAKKHLENCVACRTEVADFEAVVEERRSRMCNNEPDWEAQTRLIMDRLPAESETLGRHRSRWLRPLLAVAAAAVMAVGLGFLRPGGPAEPPAGQPSVEEILAEMDELLSDDSIPGFEIIDPWIDDRAMDFGYIEPTPSESVG